MSQTLSPSHSQAAPQAAGLKPGTTVRKAGITRSFDAARVMALHRLVAPSRKTRILDVGANPANPPPYARFMALGLAEVWGFEPDAGAHGALEASKGPDEHYLQAALGDGQEGRLHRFGWDTLGSLLPPNTARNAAVLGQFGQALALRGAEPCQTRRLDDLPDLPPPDLLKIDVQGAEAMILRHGRGKLAATGAVMAEVAFQPIYADQPLFGVVTDELAGQGFTFHRMDFTAHYALGSPFLNRLAAPPSRSQAIDGDALYLREAYLTEGAALPDSEPLRHLALITDAVFGSLDATCRILWLLDAQAGLDPEALDAYLTLIDAQTGHS